MNKRTRTKNRTRKVMEISMQKLRPILYDKELSAFNLSNKLDIFDTNLFLEDYDWMHYTLSSRMPTKAYGDITIEFAYEGVRFSTMKVKTEKKIYAFRFDSDLFQEHIIKFMQKHIRSWDEKYAFRGIEEVVNFYNAVLAHPSTEEEKDDIELYSDALWARMNEERHEK